MLSIIRCPFDHTFYCTSTIAIAQHQTCPMVVILAPCNTQQETHTYGDKWMLLVFPDHEDRGHSLQCSSCSSSERAGLNFGRKLHSWGTPTIQSNTVKCHTSKEKEWTGQCISLECKCASKWQGKMVSSSVRSNKSKRDMVPSIIWLFLVNVVHCSSHIPIKHLLWDFAGARWQRNWMDRWSDASHVSDSQSSSSVSSGWLLTELLYIFNI